MLYVRDGAGGADRALVDVNAERADGTRALDWWFPSDDGALVAYGVSDDGSEESTLRVRDVATGQGPAPTRSRARAPARWRGRPTGAASTTRATPRRARSRPPRRSTTARSSTTGWATIPPRTASCSATGATRPTGRASTCRPTAAGWRSRSARAGRRARSTSPTSARGGAPVAVAAGETAKFNVVEMLDDRLYLFTTSGAPRGRLFAVDPARPERAHWREVIKESAEVLQDVAYFRGGLAAASLQDAALRLRLYRRRRRAARRDRAARAGRADRADRRARRRRDLLRLHVVPDADRGLPRRRRDAERAGRRDVAEAAGADRRRRVRGRAGDGDVARRHEAAAVPRPPQGREARRRAARAADRLRRLRPQHAADLDAVGDPVSRGGRHLRGGRPARRRRVRRGLAPGRHARPQAERVRRLHRRGRMADREPRHQRRTGWRSRAARTAACWWARR